MNEYQVRLAAKDGERTVTVLAPTLRVARDEAELENDEEVLSVRFVRNISFSCRTRDGR